MLHIRKASEKDLNNVFELSNDDDVRKNSFHFKKIDWEEHVKWYNSKLTDKNSLFYVAYDNDIFIGYCRLDKNEKNEWIITVHINPEMRSKGYGKKFLRYICKNNPYKVMIAYVKNYNKSSKAMFLSSYFEECEYEKKDCNKFQNTVNVLVIGNKLYKNTSIYDKNLIVIKDKKDFTYEKLKRLNPKYIFVLHWNYMIPAEIYENFNCIIFHMTDLPFGRGGSPLQNLLERGIYKTKLSAIKCVKKLDAGEIYLKKPLDISCGSAKEIYARAGETAAEMIDEIIKNNPVPIYQNGEIVEFQRRTPEQSNIKDIDDINKVYDYIRMLDAPGYPRAFLENNDLIFEFFQVKKNGNSLTACVKIKSKNQ